ncbi:MAG: LamG-like jellyroll fold domain-containing protein [Kiritimatiellia bacterium]
MTEYIRAEWRSLTAASRVVLFPALLILTAVLVLASGAFPGNSDQSSQDDPDPDRDGFSTEIEMFLGTDPADSASHPTLADNREKILCYWPLTNDVNEAIQGIINGQLRHGADFKNGALNLDGRDDYVSFGTNTVLNVSSNLSFTLWCRPRFRFQPARILGKFRTKDKQRQYSAFFLGGRLWTFFSDDGSCRHGNRILKVTRPRVVHRNQWMHLGVVWDSTNGAAGVHTYIDGLEEPTWDVGSSDIQSLHSGTAEFTLGAYDIKRIRRRIPVWRPQIRIPGRPWHPKRRKKWKEKEIVINSFRGQMAQLVLCKSALTEIEVAELYMLGEDGDLQAWIHQDFDEDGMVDWWERENFGDVSCTAEGDEDGDGLCNLEEFQAGTEPNNPDSDNGGLTDGQEVHTYRTDPVVRDTDKDGFTDGEEVSAGSDPRNADSFPVTVSGTVTYEGTQTGKVWVIAVTASNSWSADWCDVVPQQGSYSITGLPNGTEYWFKAWCDQKSDGARGTDEAIGAYPDNPLLVAADLSGVDIILEDVSLDTDGDGLLNEVETGTGVFVSADDTGTDPAVADTDGDGINDGDEVNNRTDPNNSDRTDPVITIIHPGENSSAKWIP